MLSSRKNRKPDPSPVLPEAPSSTAALPAADHEMGIDDFLARSTTLRRKSSSADAAFRIYTRRKNVFRNTGTGWENLVQEFLKVKT